LISPATFEILYSHYAISFHRRFHDVDSARDISLEDFKIIYFILLLAASTRSLELLLLPNTTSNTAVIAAT